MIFRYLHIALATLLLSCSAAMAIPFNSYDPRSMGMGGSGVAVADAATAPLFNPALLSVTRYSDDFTLILPSVGIHAADPENLRGSIDTFTSGKYVDNLTAAVDSLNTAISSGVVANINSSAASVSTKLTDLNTQLNALNNKPVSLDGGVATVVGIPNKKFGVAFFAHANATAGGIFSYKDAAVINTLSTQAGCLSSAASGADVATCTTTYGSPSFNTNTLQSTITLRGLVLSEFGFAFAREYRINRQNIALGVSPKIVQARLYDIPIGLNSPSFSNFNGDDYLARYSLVNFDLGMARNYRNGWRAGLVVKNVIPYFLDFKKAPTTGAVPVATGNTLRLMPQSRAGISYTSRWSVIALDADLYRNDPAGLENYTQYISLGGELNAWNWAQLRAGYRADLVNSKRNIVSLGLGLSPFGIHTDIAVAGNENELGAYFQLGFKF